MEARDLSTDRIPSFELAMRIRHPNFDPADVSRELQLEPRRGHRRSAIEGGAVDREVAPAPDRIERVEVARAKYGR